jgi:hypothetical protein
MIVFCKLRAKKILEEEKRKKASLLCRKHKKPSKYVACRGCVASENLLPTTIEERKGTLLQEHHITIPYLVKVLEESSNHAGYRRSYICK